MAKTTGTVDCTALEDGALYVWNVRTHTLNKLAKTTGEAWLIEEIAAMLGRVIEVSNPPPSQ